MGKKIVKMLGLALGIAAADTLVLSPGLLGLGIGESALATATGVTLIAASAVALVYGAYTLLLKPSDGSERQSSFSDRGNYSEQLAAFRRTKPLREDIGIALDQLERMKKKKSAFINVLNQKFEPDGISYAKFASVVGEVEKLFESNVRGMLGRLRLYAASELADGDDPGILRFSARLRQEREALRNEHAAYIHGALGANEEILLKLDRLSLELVRLDILDPEQIDGMPGMREIDALIRQTPLYKS